MKEKAPVFRTGSALKFIRQEGYGISSRMMPYSDWIIVRKRNHVLPFHRTAFRKMGRETHSTAEDRRPLINFSPQDYLGLAQDERMAETVKLMHNSKQLAEEEMGMISYHLDIGGK